MIFCSDLHLITGIPPLKVAH